MIEQPLAATTEFRPREGVDKDLVEAERHLTGFFSVVTSDGRSRECTFELHSVFDPESGRVLVSGELCGRTIDRTWMRG